MGSYYQNQIIATNCDDEAGFKYTYQPSALKFLDGQKPSNTEHFGLYRLIEARTNPAYDHAQNHKQTTRKRMVKIYTICDYDAPENDECIWQEQISTDDKRSQRYFALDNIAQYNHLKGCIVCPETRQYFDFNQLIKADIAHMTQAKPNKYGYISSLLSPIAILTRQRLYSGGGGDYDFRKAPMPLQELVGAWRGKDIHWLDTTPTDLIDITETLLIFL